jgi:hypothetical protein
MIYGKGVNEQECICSILHIFHFLKHFTSLDKYVFIEYLSNGCDHILISYVNFVFLRGSHILLHPFQNIRYFSFVKQI